MSLERALATHLMANHQDDAAAVLEGLDDDSVAAVLSDAGPDIAARVLTRLALHRGSALLAELEPAMGRAIVEHLGIDLVADLARRMEPETRAGFLGALDPELVVPIRTRLEFPAGSAAALMDSRVLALPLDLTAGDAIARIRLSPDTIRYNLYVVDRERRLRGVLNLRELLLADREATLGSIARREVLSIRGHADSAAVLSHPAWNEAHSLPVVDEDGVYLGAIRYRTWRRLDEQRTRRRAARATATADALGDLFSTGVAGVLGALTSVATPPIGSDGDDRG